MARSSLIAFSWISSMVWKRRPFKVVSSLGNRKNSPGLSPENRVDGAQRKSDVLPDNCRWRATREPAHCRCVTSKSGFPPFQASSCAERPSNALKLPGTTLFTIWPRVTNSWWTMLSNQKTHPKTLEFWPTHPCFFGLGDPFPTHCDDLILVSTSYP